MLEERVCLGERGCRAKVIEECAGLVENRGSPLWLAEVDEAGAVAEYGMGVFGDDAELFPALGGVGVPLRGGVVVAAGFSNDGRDGRQYVVGIGGAWVVVGGENLGEVGTFECERGADECWQVGGVVGGIAGIGVSVISVRSVAAWLWFPSAS